MKNKIKNSIIFTTLAIILMYMINKIIFVFSSMKNLLSTDKGLYFEWRFGNIYYTKRGNGTPLLLIHELSPYSSDIEWDELVDKLSKDYTVYTLDLLGCGRSDKPNITYTNYLYVQLISDFTKKIIGKKTNIIATGLSSSFVIMACHNDPDLFQKMMFINPTDLKIIAKAPSKRTKLLKILLEFPVIGTLIYNIVSSRKYIENTFLENYYFNPFKVQSKYINSYYESAHLGGPNARFLLSSIKGNYVNVNIIHALKEINHSIYLVGGVEEPYLKDTLETYVFYNNAIEVTSIKNAKHLPQLETPQALLEQIKIYFSEQN
ncbi:MAG TPA: alpha/beta fold hydrolase [Candidatus Merdenecus merdavium]|nr:alpha/beta fold hydrolase [Candidatus Merdenecus merdavium]